MNELFSLIVPLDTLAGWPPAPNPTPLQVLGLLVGFPALGFVVVFAIAKASSLAKAGRGESSEPTDSIWLGGRADQPAIGDAASEVAAIEAGPNATDPAKASSDVGGASARW